MLSLTPGLWILYPFAVRDLGCVVPFSLISLCYSYICLLPRVSEDFNILTQWNILNCIEKISVDRLSKVS